MISLMLESLAWSARFDKADMPSPVGDQIQPRGFAGFAHRQNVTGRKSQTQLPLLRRLRQAQTARPSVWRLGRDGDSRKIPVNLLAAEAANERHCATLEDKANAVIAHANAVVFAPGFQPFEIGNLLKGPPPLAR
jgi:hypothetical protein